MIARKIAMEGGQVILNDLDSSLAVSASAAISDEGGLCDPCPGDASDVSFIRKMVSDTVEKYGTLDAVVANAGITTFGDFFPIRRSRCKNFYNSTSVEHFFGTGRSP